MTTRLIRLGLIISVLWLIYTSVPSFFIKLFHAAGYANHSEVSTFAYTMETISTLMLSLPLIFVLIWALHNLRALRWLSAELLTAMIKVVLVVGIVALIVSTAVYFVQSAPYLPNIYKQHFFDFLKLMDWLPYTLAELSLLGFAYKQLVSKAAGKNISEQIK